MVMKPQREHRGGAVELPSALSGGRRQLSRFAGLVLLCRPDWSASVACHVAHILIEQKVREFREVGSLADYLNYLDTQLLRYTEACMGVPLRVESCELEVLGWSGYWQQYRKMS